MDAKAVADRVYKEHSISVTEEEILHAQARLQEERKLNETPPVTEKKDENTTSTTFDTTADTMPTDERKIQNIVPAPSGQRTGTVENAPVSQPKDTELNLIIPKGVPETPPVPTIDDLIRRGYRDRDDLEAFMKESFRGKAYRKDVMERLKLFEARQPPFNDIPLPRDTTSTTAGTTSSTTSDTTSSTAPNAQNTPVLQSSGTVPDSVPAPYRRS
jgi:hypothetical protein